MSVHQIWATVAIAISVVAAVVVLSINHVDAQSLLLVIAAVVSPVISAIVVSVKVQGVSDKVDGVDRKVNGHLTELTKKIPDGRGGE